MKNILELINLESSAEIFIGDQMSYFQSSGNYRVHLMCSPNERLESFAEREGVDYKPVVLERQISLWKDIKAFFEICRYIKRNHIDIIICHQVKSRTLGIWASFLMGVKQRIIFSHGVLHETMHGINRFLIMLNDRLLSRMSTKVICVSHHVMEARLRDKIDRPGIQTIVGSGSCNGIDTDLFDPDKLIPEEVVELKRSLNLSNNDFVIGFCGRLVKDKGVEELIRGYELLCEHYPERKAKLLVIGSPENRDSIDKELYKKISNTTDIIFTGHVEHKKMPYYYSLMNILVFPSHRDGLGLAPLEAQAMKIPSLVSDVTGCRETIIPGETGEYIALTGESIENKVSVFFDSDVAKSYGEKGRAFVIRNFDHKAFLGQIFNLIESLAI